MSSFKKNISPINKILDNRFSKELSKRLQISMTLMRKREGFQYGQNNHHLLRSDEKYVSRVYRLQSLLIDQLEHINYTYIFISRYPFGKQYAQKRITQLHYIDYHFEVVLHKVHTICELMKLIINEVYTFNIPHEQCNWNTLSKRLKSDTKPMLSIDQYYQTFKDLIHNRHISAHRGLLPDEEREKIEIDFGFSLYLMSDNGKDLDEEVRKTISLPWIKYNIREYKKGKLDIIKSIQNATAEVVQSFLSSLYSEFIQRLKNFEENN